MMADESILPEAEEPVSMRMTFSDYEEAFALFDLDGFAEEEEFLEPERVAGFRQLIWYKRPEVLALILGIVTWSHAMFVQWIWPLLKARLPKDSPYLH
ncbi:hypothetical protein F5Y08DRAFT_338419 [Xylaria arbuscula]|nr:hypothetical protein F5Y08DRAFT_338419 [Xylaria arbuscula]